MHLNIYSAIIAILSHCESLNLDYDGLQIEVEERNWSDRNGLVYRLMKEMVFQGYSIQDLI